MNRAEILGIWQCAEATFPEADLEAAITFCLPSGFEIDVIFDENLHDPQSQQALENMGLPCRVFEALQRVFAAHRGLIEALRRAAPIMRLDFSRPGHFWIPGEFWQTVSGNMLSHLVEAGGTPETLLALSLERDLGL